MERRDEHAADPEQPETASYAEGLEHEPHTPEEERVGSFADGEETLPHDHRHKGRFSEGEEELPDTPEKDVERDYGEGIERPRGD
jgi:hypothetical protein